MVSGRFGKNNPMYGKCHKNREKFRKHTHANVDYADTKTRYTSGGNKVIKYRKCCPICNKDMGYHKHEDALRKCIKCQGDVNCKTTINQRRVKASIKASLASRLKKRFLSKNRKSTFDMLPYSVDELVEHLESQFKPGMSWYNYGRGGWHIDHVIPDSWFNYESICDDEFQKSWSLENLQPMWEAENFKKSNCYEGEYVEKS